VPASASAESLVLVVEAAPPGVDPARVRAAVARELGVAVALAPASDRPGALVLRAGGERRAVLIYRAEDGRVLERAVDLPASSDQAVEMIVLLAGNLVRNEAAELSEALRAQARGAGSAPAASPPPPLPRPPPLPPPPPGVHDEKRELPRRHGAARSSRIARDASSSSMSSRGISPVRLLSQRVIRLTSLSGSSFPS